MLGKSRALVMDDRGVNYLVTAAERKYGQPGTIHHDQAPRTRTLSSLLIRNREKLELSSNGNSSQR